MSHRASVGIISIGEMGLGIAKLLAAQNYRLLTNITGRSQHTQDRASSAQITLLDSDIGLYNESDYILSIVPPKDALATAQRIVDAATTTAAAAAAAGSSTQSKRKDGQPLYYLDLNAIAPSSANEIAKRFAALGDDLVRFIDGGIIGGPPKPIATEDTSTSGPPPAAADENDAAAIQDDISKTWYRPSIVLSGPHKLGTANNSTTTAGAHLATILNTKHVGTRIGDASGLKCCFASLSKGFTALAIQSFSTAAQLGVLDALRDELRGQQNAPSNADARAVRGLVGMPPKSGRWVVEMQEIGKTFREVGGWNGSAAALVEGGSIGGSGSSSSVFDEIAEVYRYVAEDTVLGQEKSGHRVRGTTGEDVVAAILESRSSVREKKVDT